MDTNLRQVLARVGHPTETVEMADGSIILVLPHGGRVLGLYAVGSKDNFLWTHPALSSELEARTLYASDSWQNSGGDRAWLSPEVDFFLPRYPEVTPYVQPREIDPGNFVVTLDAGCVTLTNRFASRLSRSGRIVDLKLTRRLRAAFNPLRNEASDLVARLEYAGYSLHSRLEFTGAERDYPQVGLWSLLQMPHGGELLIPTISKAKARTYFGTIASNDLVITEHLVRYRMSGAGEQKFGISAATLTGRAGYLYRSEIDTSLVIRSFFPNPSGDYVDVPWGDPQTEGSAVEACNVNSALGAFSELEYHAPAIGGSRGASYCDDISQVWGFRGPEKDILEVGRILLSPEL